MRKDERKLEATEELKRAIAELQEKLDNVAGPTVADETDEPVHEESAEYDEASDDVDYSVD